jgi:hypothetical protein
VQVITTDGKSQQVVDAISSWRSTNDKGTKGLDNDVIVTPLSGASAEYISSVIKQTSFQTMQVRSAKAPKIMQMQSEGLMSLAQGEVDQSSDPMEQMISGFY